jgi:hypothetical protein
VTVQSPPGPSGNYPTSHQRTAGVLARQKDIETDKLRRASRKVASESVDATECADLLGMLGLTAAMGKEPTQP